MKKILTTCCMLALLSACSGNKNDSGDMSESAGSSTCIDSSDVKNVLGSVYFGYDKSNLDHASKEALKTQITTLKQEPSSVRIEGNCDMRGTDDYNMGLGERRANAVKKFLVSGGMSEDKIQVVSNGKQSASGTTNEGYAKDRRADTILVK